MPAYEDAVDSSWVKEELWAVRNVHPSFHRRGPIPAQYVGMVYSALETFVLKGRGPWTLRNVTCTGHCNGLSNPSPWLRADGTALLAWRMGADAQKGKGKWSLSLASAPSLFGPYSPLSGNWSVPVFVPEQNCEDPFLWVSRFRIYRSTH